MPESRSLTSPTNPRIKAVVRLRQQRHRRQSSRFIAEGTREISRALAAGLKMCEIFLSRKFLGINPQLDDLNNAISNMLTISGNQSLTDSINHTPLFEVTPAIYEKIAYRQNPEGILAVFEQKNRSFDDVPPPTQNDLWLVAVNTTKPGNLGAMARTAEAAGATGLLLADSTVDIYNPNAIRASTAAVFGLTIISATSTQIRQFLAERNIQFIAATPQTPGDRGSADPLRKSFIYNHVDMTKSTAIIIGPEDQGLDHSWLTQNQQNTNTICVSIPTKGSIVDSINASSAAAVLLFEAVRQRDEKLNT